MRKIIHEIIMYWYRLWAKYYIKKNLKVIQNHKKKMREILLESYDAIAKIPNIEDRKRALDNLQKIVDKEQELSRSVKKFEEAYGK